MSRPPNSKFVSTTDTQASTTGSLPESIGVILLVVVSIGILSITTSIGYSPTLLIGLMGTGAIAAIAVRTAVTGSQLRVALGVTVLWGAALAFAVTAMLLVVQTPGTVLPLFVASVAALGPFSILGNTIQSYGHGAGRKVLARYVTGTLIVSAVIIALLLVTVLQETVLSWGSQFLSGTMDGAAETAPRVRVLIATILYTGLLYSARSAVHSLPLETLVSVEEFGRVATFRNHIDHIHYYTRFVFLAYLVVGIGTYAQIQRQGQSPTLDTITSIVALAAHPTLVSATAIVTAVLLFTVLVLKPVKSNSSRSNVTGLTVLKTLIPPILLLGISITATVLFGGQISELLVQSISEGLVTPGTVPHDLITTQPPLVVLLILPVGLLSSAIVFLIPTILTKLNNVDASLAGITAATMSLTGIVVLAVLTRQPFGVILGGVVLAVITWELGEYSTVAVGELQSPGDSETPSGFTSITAVHMVATTIVAVTAVALVVAAMTVFSGVMISESIAGVALILCSIAVAAILLILSG